MTGGDMTTGTYTGINWNYYDETEYEKEDKQCINI